MESRIWITVMAAVLLSLEAQAQTTTTIIPEREVYVIEATEAQMRCVVIVDDGAPATINGKEGDRQTVMGCIYHPMPLLPEQGKVKLVRGPQ
jgi:hypothetical protein